ncbi:MAG: 30S ribosomal protein S21 [Cytophagales bacterium]|nr:MAG: 30S ribosomal protein S21 [Cytophagales bacterium]
MLLINIKENENIDKALKRFKKKFEKTGVLKELRRRQAFIKPSIISREQWKDAVYKNVKFGNHNDE